MIEVTQYTSMCRNLEKKFKLTLRELYLYSLVQPILNTLITQNHGVTVISKHKTEKKEYVSKHEIRKAVGNSHTGKPT